MIPMDFGVGVLGRSIPMKHCTSVLVLSLTALEGLTLDWMEPPSLKEKVFPHTFPMPNFDSLAALTFDDLML